MSTALAQYYGLPAPAAEWAPVDVSGTAFGGVLTHGSVLVTHALPTISSPIHRGLFVRERLLCQELPDPPANLDTSPPPVDPAASTRERYTEHSSNPACSGCHTLIDPIGFSFEHFDASGRWRALDGVHPIDTQGEITGTTATNARFDGLGELADLLAESEDVRACYITQWIRHGFGVDDALPLDCYVNRVGPQVDTLRGVLPALAGTSHFRERVGGETELDVPGAELVPTAPGMEPEAPEPVDPPSVPPTEPPTAPGPEVTPGAALVVTEASRWETGYCANAAVENQTDADLRWAVEHRLEGTLNNLWNAEGSADTGRVVFRGVAWNATLAPGQRAEFGWCATL
jgi:cellulase/cellobiase CelA1